MAKLQSISWATVFLILSGTNLDFTQASALGSQPESLYLAQNSEQEMIDALEERDKKIESGLDKIRKFTGTEKSQPEPKEEEEDLSPEEMIDALEAENLNVESLEELEVVQNVVDNPEFSEEEMLSILQGQDIEIENLEQLKKLKKIAGKKMAFMPEDSELSADMAFKMLVVGVPALILLFLIGKPIFKGITDTVIGNYQAKFGKLQVAERSLKLHNNAFKEIQNIGRKINKLADDKFSSDEFKLLISIKVNAIKEIDDYKELNYKSELLRAAILAQKSFLKLESTELRYRSRKQQQFYQYVADNLEENLDKQEFSQKIKAKQREILPLISTDEGRAAINSYAKDIEDLSKHELGLKLLALFKKFDLQDFSIIRDVSDIIEGLAGHDLLNSKNLILTIKEYYDIFHKLSPILDINQDDQTTKTYARILQIVALMHRHGDAYLKFKELINLLRKWEKSYETVKMVREQYSQKEYTVPPEFKQELLGIDVYHKYAEYIASL